MKNQEDVTKMNTTELYIYMLQLCREGKRRVYKKYKKFFIKAGFNSFAELSNSLPKNQPYVNHDKQQQRKERTGIKKGISAHPY